MNDLLDLAIRAHGGLERWEKISRFRAVASITGAIWPLTGSGGLLDDIVLEGSTREQCVVLAPFPERGQRAVWRPSIVAIEKLDGSQVREQEEPSDAFPPMALTVPWDPLQVVHLAAQLTWSYLVSPFIFAGDGFVTQELGPWPQGDEVWRRLEVRFPESLSAHSRLQTCYFDDRGLLRRQDYSVDAPGGQAMLDYPSAYREFDGIAVPTRRRAYVRGPDDAAVPGSITIAIDLGEVSFT